MDYLAKALEWKNNKDLDPVLKEELNNLDDNGLKEAFGADLEFGTGGLRGILGVGTNRMNYYVVRKATFGFGSYLKKMPNALKKGIVISYDNRFYSKEFALDSANLLSDMGFKVYVFSNLRATPELSFGVRYFKAIGGIMITASHNPKNYNGYKIYDEDGCQLIPDLANQVIDLINKVDDVFALKAKGNKELIHFVDKEVDEAYIKEVNSIRINKDLKANFNVTFTPLHGTGSVLGPRILEENGFKCYPVEAQMVADPAFSAVKTSNPENIEAFNEAIEQGLRLGSKLVLANDPDADRLGICVFHSGSYIPLTGNQSAEIMTKYICEQLKEKGRLPKDGWLFTTNVSSSLPIKIAHEYGLNTYVSLTGFKYIGNQAKKIEGKGTYVYGFEESYGCLIKDFVRDKDAMQAILFICEIEAYLETQGKDLIDYLEEIYNQYGYYVESQSNIFLEGLDGKEKIKKIMNHFRENELFLDYGRIVRKEDNLLKIAYDYKEEGIHTEGIDLDKSNVLKFIFEDDSWFVLRPSGTEPKLKVYYGTIGKTNEEANKKNNQLKEEVLELLEKVE